MLGRVRLSDLILANPHYVGSFRVHY